MIKFFSYHENRRIKILSHSDTIKIWICDKKNPTVRLNILMEHRLLITSNS